MTNHHLRSFSVRSGERWGFHGCRKEMAAAGATRMEKVLRDGEWKDSGPRRGLLSAIFSQSDAHNNMEFFSISTRRNFIERSCGCSFKISTASLANASHFFGSKDVLYEDI